MGTAVLAQADIDRRVDAARALRLQGQATTSTSALQDITRSHPTHYRATYNLALALADVGRHAEAEAAFARAAQLREVHGHPDVTIYNSFGWQLLRTGQVEPAIAQFAKGYAVRSQLSDASRSRLLANYGVALMQARRYDEAEVPLREAAERFDNPVAKRGLQQIATVRAEATIWALVFSADATERAAGDELRRARAAGIQNPELVRQAGLLRGIARFGDRSEAERALKLALSFRKDAYIVRFESWCPGATRQRDITTCLEPSIKR
jgi:Tfp pilus assembly protein PilF